MATSCSSNETYSKTRGPRRDLCWVALSSRDHICISRSDGDVVNRTTKASRLEGVETRTVPIVFVQVADPVGSSFIQSLARPGGNITGLTNFELSMAGKWLELLKEI